MTWTPTAENINALPEGLRDYIHRLEANTDPAGELRRAMVAEMERDALRKMMEWQPIETAPTDEPILIGPTKRLGICVAMNHSRDGWVTETPSEWVPIYQPTHWRPLPEPPA